MCVCVHIHMYTSACAHSGWNVSRDANISASPRFGMMSLSRSHLTGIRAPHFLELLMLKRGEGIARHIFQPLFSWSTLCLENHGHSLPSPRRLAEASGPYHPVPSVRHQADSLWTRKWQPRFRGWATSLFVGALPSVSRIAVCQHASPIEAEEGAPGIYWGWYNCQETQSGCSNSWPLFDGAEVSILIQLHK